MITYPVQGLISSYEAISALVLRLSDIDKGIHQQDQDVGVTFYNLISATLFRVVLHSMLAEHSECDNRTTIGLLHHGKREC